MKSVFIKYNPFIVKTIVEVDGVLPKANSYFNNVTNTRFQEWVELIPEKLKEEFNCNDFEIKFEGMQHDYDDLKAVFENKSHANIKLKDPTISKDFKDRVKEIEEIFKDIQEGPFKELKEDRIVEAFKKAKNQEFEITVVATMSAGKSTLINALLGSKLLHSHNLACTAKITRIKDNDKAGYSAKVYTDGEPEIYPDFTLDVMKKVNEDEKVNQIEIEGDIPFVTADGLKLVLVDTPGPNSWKNPSHKEATYRKIEDASHSMILYVLNGTQLGVNDDANLLNHVIECMQKGGKQAKDRFIFVVNKLDSLKPDEDDAYSILKKIREDLAEKNIINASVFPLTASAALDIRKFDTSTEEEQDDTEILIKKINKRPFFHFEHEKYNEFNHLPKRIVDGLMNEAKNETDDHKKALIHTGIRSLEEAISLYVNKYARTTKIKDLIDTFNKKLEEVNAFEKLKEEIKGEIKKQSEDFEENEKKIYKLQDQFRELQAKIKESTSTKNAYKQKVDEIDYSVKINERIDELNRALLVDLDKFIHFNNSSRIPEHEAQAILKKINDKFTDLEIRLKIGIEKIIKEEIETSAKKLVDSYKEELHSLAEGITFKGIQFDPFSYVKSDVTSRISLSSLSFKSVRESKVVNEKVFVKGEYCWYLPWKWFSEGDRWEDRTRVEYVDMKYLNMEKLAVDLVTGYRMSIKKNKEACIEFARQNTSEIKTYFSSQFDEIDKIVDEKIDELVNLVKEVEAVEANLVNNKTELDDKNTKLDNIIKKEQWLSDIRERMENVVKI